ncbi:hypothetical protein DYBT9275_06106 [Dyadobacter sp. CECT 9275]|uniref:Glycosyltransferase 2-like domain-containing protein n=1 Tax=Dyadobacter helix TaxID=2822344 RepID=A0A916JHG6_9BACT|nr:glycosyltransferase [Dyadobacter sp. CECT 9275]CAG5018943.1 hypothetical protein DYBT9275_06106 [Dyadobacter sp. CECT 9275]
MAGNKEGIEVSVLVAARNEESNILRCLESLARLDYPAGKIEVCIGDDDSSDRTAEIINTFMLENPNFRYVRITSAVSNLRGKANVLAQLAKRAGGEYFFFCDADIAVLPTWINAMLAHFDEHTGVVVGLTRMRKGNLFADFLSLEWLFTLTITRLLSLFNIPVTGLGNNMAISRKAYEAVGGYETIGFSIVEDYALFMAVARRKLGFKMAYNPRIVSVSEPVLSFADWLIQRRRWMQGVMKSSWLTRMSILAAAFVFPSILVMQYWFPVQAGLVFALHYSFVTLIAVATILLLRQHDLWKTVFLFWFYMFVSLSIMLVNYFFPGKMNWKGRVYDKEV